MSRFALILVIFLSKTLILGAQTPFFGSFTIKLSNSDQKVMILTGSVLPESEGGKIALRIEDEQVNKGVIRRIVFSPYENKWTLLMAVNKIKQGTVIQRKGMFNFKNHSTRPDQNFRKYRRTISGYNCININVTDSICANEIWYSKQFNFPSLKLLAFMGHCGLFNEFSLKSIERTIELIKGGVIEVKIENKNTKATTKIEIISIKEGQLDHELFSTKGFQLSYIPEGQNCGNLMEK